jgi:hypothetical protein
MGGLEEIKNEAVDLVRNHRSLPLPSLLAPVCALIPGYSTCYSLV